jgi:hypothetical protein
MGEVRDPPVHAVDERNRAVDLAERPGRKRKIDHRGGARIHSETKGQIVVITAGLELRERPFQVILCLAVVAGEPASDPGSAMSDTGLGRVGSRLDVVEEGRCVCPHRRQVAPCEAADPQTVIDRQSPRRIPVAR